jgi:hypothetical protein
MCFEILYVVVSNSDGFLTLAPRFTAIASWTGIPMDAPWSNMLPDPLQL